MLPYQFDEIQQLTEQSIEFLESGNFEKSNSALIKRQQLLEKLKDHERISSSADDSFKGEFVRLLQWIQAKDATVVKGAIELKKIYQEKVVNQTKTSNALKQYKHNIG